MKRIAKMRRQTSRARGETIVRFESDCAIIPKEDESRFDSFGQFVFETVFRLIALRLTNSRMTATKTLPESRAPAVRLWRERVNSRVHSSPCALYHTVRDVLSGNRRIFRRVPRRAGRSSLNAAHANAQREKY